jgi:hypothetical protein
MTDHAELVKRLIGPQSAEIDYATRQEAARAIEALVRERDVARQMNTALITERDELELELASVYQVPPSPGYAYAAGREAGIREAAEVVRGRGPATQDMTSTMICDALDDAADAILALLNKPQE